MSSSNPKPLQGISICIYLPKQSLEVQTKVQNMALALGAKVTRELSRTHTTCLVTDSVGSTHYREALMLQIPIVRYRWIDHCMQRKQLILNWDEYRLNLFQGLTFCATQIPPPLLEPLVPLIQGSSSDGTSGGGGGGGGGGGIFKSQLLKDETTHLIVGENLITTGSMGAKYAAAKKWNIQIVTVKWVEDCVREKRKFKNKIFICLSVCLSIYLSLFVLYV
jgi:hypothetical protein